MINQQHVAIWLTVIQQDCDVLLVDHHDQGGVRALHIGTTNRYRKGPWELNRHIVWINERKRLHESFSNRHDTGFSCYGDQEWVRIRPKVEGGAAPADDGIAIFGKVHCSSNKGDSDKELDHWWVSRRTPISIVRAYYTLDLVPASPAALSTPGAVVVPHVEPPKR